MKSFFRLTAFALVLTQTISQAQSFSPTFYFFPPPSHFKHLATFKDEDAVAKPDIASASKGAAFVISTFNRNIVAEFAKAWRQAGNGVAPTECVVLILRMGDGSFAARSQGFTNEYKRFSFPWHPGAIAIVHSHPNGSEPKPQMDDMELADKLHVPIFTITSKGMFVYDPFTKKISKIQNGLDWTEPSKWERTIALK